MHPPNPPCIPQIPHASPKSPKWGMGYAHNGLGLSIFSIQNTKNIAITTTIAVKGNPDTIAVKVIRLGPKSSRFPHRLLLVSLPSLNVKGRIMREQDN